jgi:hypothetical protein
MRFKTAADTLKARGVTLDQIAGAFTPPVTPNTVNRWKMDDQRLRPREGWEEVLARLAVARADELQDEERELRQLAAELEAAYSGA